MFQRENISSSILAVSTLQNTSADIFPLKQTACPGTPTIFTANVACYPPTDESREKKITMTVDASLAKFTDLSSRSGIQMFSSPYATVDVP